MKSDNISYRYDVEKMELVFKNEKIDNPRKALDFLLDKYWWEKKQPIQYAPVTPAAYDGAKMTTFNDEPLSFTKLKDEAVNGSEQPTYLSLLNGMAGILFADEKEEYEIKIRKATNLTDKQRDALLSNLKQMR